MRRLGMSTEGGQRWARGVDPAGAEPVCDQAARLMADLAGGTVAAGRLSAGPGVGEREAIRLDWGRSSERLGAPADPEFAAAHLRAYGCRTEVADRRTVLAVPPSWRFDLELWADLEEEVARGWGYDQLPATLPGATGGGLTDAQRLRRQAREVLAGMGVTEVQTYPFLSQAALERLGLPADDPRRETLRLANPLSEEAPELRTTLLCGLAEVAGRNLARGLDGVAVYELGAVFLPNPKEELPAEPLTLGVLLAGQAPAGRHDDPRRPFDFADAKGVVEGLVAALGIPGAGFRAAEPPPYHPGRCAAVLLEDRPVGVLGQLHPRVAAACELPAAAFAVELELGPLLAAVPRMRPAATPSPYPELSFDVAFLVPPGVPASDLEDVLREAGGELLARLTLFDAYQGPSLPPGHRNLAYRVALQAADRTLTDADGAATRDRMAALAAERRRRSSAPPGRVVTRVGSVRPGSWGGSGGGLPPNGSGTAARGRASWSTTQSQEWRGVCARPGGSGRRRSTPGWPLGQGPTWGWWSASRPRRRPAASPPTRSPPPRCAGRGPSSGPAWPGRCWSTRAAPTPPPAPTATPTRPAWPPAAPPPSAAPPARCWSAAPARSGSGWPWPTPPRPPTRPPPPSAGAGRARSPRP